MGSNKSTKKQLAQTRDEKGRITGGTPPVGFHTNPEWRSGGRWKPEDSISYNYHKFLSMSQEEFNSFKPVTMAQRTAYDMVKNANSSRSDIVKEVTDRTEGRAPQKVDISNPDGSLNPFNALTAEELRKLAGK